MLTTFGPSRTAEPYLSCRILCVSSGRPLYVSKKRHKLVNFATKGPGMDLIGDFRYPQTREEIAINTIEEKLCKTRLKIDILITRLRELAIQERK
jgi:hypothetical protein